jgi:pimeloyl-ACP methyl ester carboxylesterase
MKIPVELKSNGDIIRGLFYPSQEQLPAPIVLLLGGFPPGGGDSLLGQALAQRHNHVLTFAYRGILQSEGTFSVRNVQQDIQAAITFLRQDDVLPQFSFDAGELILGGLSFGGGMVLAYAARHPEIRRIFALAGDDYGQFARDYRQRPEFTAMIDGLMDDLKTSPETVRFNGHDLMQELIDDPDPYDLRLNAPALADRDILLIGGWDDVGVTLEDKILPFYRALKEAGSQTVRITAVQDDHAFAKCGHEIADLLTRWLKSPGPT